VCVYIYIYIYIWKCHNETPFVTTINKQQCPFLKNERQEGKTIPGIGTSEREEGIRKG
jgi:hypothetical protein